MSSQPTPCQVGDRYKLEKVLGYGSFSCVCLATDTRTGEKVSEGVAWVGPSPLPSIVASHCSLACMHGPLSSLRPAAVADAQVALKRIGDVLQSPDQAKRVLREISILRRLRHPNIIGLRDCFLKPAATGVVGGGRGGEIPGSNAGPRPLWLERGKPGAAAAVKLLERLSQPLPTGQCRMVNGKLVNMSVDLYIALEFADGGDLFSMRGQLSRE